LYLLAEIFMTSGVTEQKFAALLAEIAPDSKLRRTWRLDGGISASMTALEIEEENGRSHTLVVRQYPAPLLAQNPHIAADEFRLLQRLQQANLPSPAPYFYDASGRILGQPCLVMAYCEGQPDFAPADLPEAMAQFAAHLAQIHQVDELDLDLAFLPRLGSDCPELNRSQPAPPDEALPSSGIRLALAAGALKPGNTAVLLHGDYWPGNVLWQNGKLTAVIDWEDARLGDPLFDLAVSRLDVAWIFGQEAMEVFTQVYTERTAVDTANLPYWDLCAALRLARLVGADLPEWVAFFAPYGRHDITIQSLRHCYDDFVTQALEKLGKDRNG